MHAATDIMCACLLNSFNTMIELNDVCYKVATKFLTLMHCGLIRLNENTKKCAATRCVYLIAAAARLTA